MILSDDKIYGVFNELKILDKNSADLINAVSISDELIRLQNFFDGTTPLVRVISLENTEQLQLHKLINWLVNEKEYIVLPKLPHVREVIADEITFKLSIENAEEFLSVALTEPAVCNIIFCPIDKTQYSSDRFENILAALSADCGYSLVCFTMENNESNKLFETVKANSINADCIYIDQLPETKFIEWLLELSNKLLLKANFNYALIGEVEKVSRFLELAIQDKYQKTRNEKSHIQLQLQNISSPSSFSVSSVSSQFANMITNRISQIEKKIADDMEAFSRPVTGDFANIIEQFVETIVVLDEKKKTKKTSLTIPQKNLDDYFERIKQATSTKFEGYITLLNDEFAQLENDYGRQLRINGIPELTHDYSGIELQHFKQIQKSALRLEKEYEGRRPSKGVMEYVSALRKYLSILPFVAALIPVFGKEYSEFWNDHKRWTAFISVVLVMIGLVDLVYNVNREAKESKEKELQRAKDLLKTESKRILGEITRSAIKTFSDFLKSQNQILQNNINRQLTDFFLEKQRKDNDRKNRLTLQLNNITEEEMKINNLIREKSMVSQKIVMLRKGFAEQLLITSRKIAL